MEPLQIHDGLDGEDQSDYSVMSDIIDDVVRDNQKSLMEPEESELEWHPASIKKLREARRTNRVSFQNSSNANPNPKTGVISDDEGQEYPIAGPPEGMGEFFEEERSARGEPPWVPHRDRANQEISIIEIFESDTERTDGEAQVGLPEGSITEHRKYEKISSRSKPVTEKVHNVIKPPPPSILRKRLITPNKRSIVRSPVFQSSPPTAREPSPAIDDLFARKYRTRIELQ